MRHSFKFHKLVTNSTCGANFTACYECHRDVTATQIILARGLASLGIQSLDAARLMSK